MELLVVIAIIGILAVISGPALTAITNSGGVNRTVNGISLLMEQARAYAMSHNTYVWVGLYPDPVTPKLTAVAVSGTTGVQADLVNGTFTPITRIQTYNNVVLNPPANLTLTGLNAAYDDILNSGLNFNLTPPGAAGAITFLNVVQFSPQGDAAISTAGTPNHVIRIVLQPVRGGIKTNLDPNVAALEVGEITGQVEVFRK
jgi:type II secretory pathway pseudopilin PulG